MPRLRTEAAKNILFDLLQIEEPQNFFQRRLAVVRHGINQPRFAGFANPSRN
jgi:hypothetical protein